MRIALLSDCYPPRLGGIETQVRDLGRALAGAGHEVHVVTATPAGPGARGIAVDVESGVTVRRHTLGLPFDLPVNPRLPAQVRDLIRGMDVAHAHMGVISPVARDLAALALDLGVPTAITWHSVLGEGAMGLMRRRGTLASWARAGAALSAVSTMAAARVARAAREEAQVAVLPNGIDIARWRPPPDQAVARADDAMVRIVTAMRMAPRKRVWPLLSMLRQVHAAAPGRVHATVFGDGPLLALARGRAAAFAEPVPAPEAAGIHQPDGASRPGWLDLPGRVGREALVAAYAGADLYLAPTRLEAFGIAALEARTAGLPVVARAGSGTADFIVPERNGLLAGDDAGLVAATVRLVEDEVLRTGIRQTNLRTPPLQSWPYVLERAVSEYRRAGAGGG